MSKTKSIIIVGFYLVMLIVFFNYFSDPLQQDTSMLNIYQVYIMAVLTATICAMVFNMLCARIELGKEWSESSFFFNRWTAIYMCLVYSGAILGSLMFFIPNPLILWRIYQVINFFLIAFLTLDRVESILNMWEKIR